MTLEFNALQTTTLAALLLILGMFLRTRVKFLQNFCIPIPVIGGFLFAIAMWAAHESGAGDVVLDTALQTPSMIVFFTTIGLGGSFKLFKVGGKALLIYLICCWTLAITQTLIGAGVAKLVGLDSIIGLMAGAISLEGGHGAAATFGGAVQSMGFDGAAAVALACATFGLFVGGLLGGPVAKFLIDKNQLTLKSDKVATRQQASEGTTVSGEGILKMLALILVLMFSGEYVAQAVVYAIQWVSLTMTGSAVHPFFPAYVGAMIAAIVFRNLNDQFQWVTLNEKSIEILSSVSLSIFLTMAMMKLRIWDLYDLALPVLLILAAQIIFLTLFTVLVVFRLLGRDYDAAVMSAGMMGHGLGATPNGVANMTSVCEKYQVFSYKAFLIVPLSGAVLIDIVALPIITWSINYFG